MESELPEDARLILAAHWSGMALLEHASVASFARFSLQLMAVGAPASLVEAAHRAALDEIEHARLTFRLASRYEGRPLGPGPLPFDGGVAVDASLAALAVATAREGCVGETVGAAEANALLERARDPEVRAALALIARDEASHAELAWQTVRWALDQGDDTVRRAVAGAFSDELQRPLGGSDSADLVAHADVLADHGTWLPSALGSIRRRAIDEVVRPALQALLTAA
ncbi:MAG TPA: ferritin-like domain-containing protein [Polyangiaceae bacterium]